MRLARLFALVAFGVLMIAGCAGGVGTTDEAATQPTVQTSAVGFAMHMPPGWHDKFSIKIGGERDTDALDIYPCKNEVPATCFEMDEDGNIKDWDATARGNFSELCPTVDLPRSYGQGLWSFYYTVYEGLGCVPGHEITTYNNANNFVCYDSHDLLAREYANMCKDENLLVGTNTNQIWCLTRDSTKLFELDVCIETTTCDETAMGNVLQMDCGCNWDPRCGSCKCDWDTQADLPPFCTIREDMKCDILCAPDAVPDGKVTFKNFYNPTTGNKAKVAIDELGPGGGHAEDSGNANWTGYQTFDIKYLGHPVHKMIASFDGSAPTEMINYELDANSFVLKIKADGPGTWLKLKDLRWDGYFYPGPYEATSAGGMQVYKFIAPNIDYGFEMTGVIEKGGTFTQSGDGYIELTYGNYLAP